MSIIFHRMDINNFLAIGSARVHLNNKRLVLIQGENKDDPSQISNGSGKSSILDALSWVLYGTTARDVTGDAVINQTAGKNCLVRIQFEDEHNEYMIERYRKHGSHKNRLLLYVWEGAGWGEITAGTDKLTQGKITKTIGCSVDVFNAAVYIGQEQMPNLPLMTDKQLKLLIEEAAGVDRLKSAYEESRSRLLKAQSKFDAAHAECQTLDRQVEQQKETVKQTALKKDQWEADKKEKITNGIEDLKRIKIEWKKDKSAFDKSFPSGDTNIRKDIDEAKQSIAAVSGEQKTKTALEKELLTAEKAAAKQKSVAVIYNKRANELKDELDNITSRVGTQCGECGKPYSATDMAEAKRLAKEKAQTSTVDFERSVKVLKDLLDVASGKQEKLDKHIARMTNIDAQIELESKGQRLLAAYQNIYSDLERRKADLLADVERVKQERMESNPFTDLLVDQEQRLKDVCQEHQKALDNRSISEDAVKLAKAVTNVFSPAGVRAHILDTVTPFLNDRTATYLSQLSDGNIKAEWSTLSKTAKGEDREKFQIAVSSVTGANNFKGLSGGEKRKVRLSCSMALQDLVASRASKPINLYVCDEIDDALDEAGLERLMGVLEAKAKERGTVLVVSHNDLASWIRNTATIIKEGGKASIEVASGVL